MLELKNENIVILNHHASAPDTGGGGRHYEISKYLSELNYNVTVLASSYDNGKKTYRWKEEVKETIFGDKFKFIAIKTKPAYKNNVIRFINYFDYMIKAGKFNEFKDKPDVIIASSVHPLAWVAGYKLSKKYNAKFIVEVRDLWPLDMYEDFTGIARKGVFSFFESLEKRYYKLADAIITTAPFAYEYMEEKYNISKDKIFHIPHGIDIEEFDKNTNQNDDVISDDLIRILENNFCITYTGLLSKAEGLPTLVKAANYLKDISDMKIVIVGSGKEGDKLRNIIDKEELDNVIMIEKQPKGVIPVILKKSKVLFCGLEERKAFNYGISKNKFYDYMASSKPIIFASSVRGSLIDKAEAGITIKPNDPENLASTIKYIYNNIDKLGKQYGENGRKYVKKYHTNEKITEQFLEVISYCNAKSENNS